MSRRGWVLSGVALISFMCGAGVGVVTSSESFAERGTRDPYARLDTFAQVLSVVEGHYVEEVDRESMIDGAIHGMIRALDPHSSFMSRAERAEFEGRTSGQFVGIGVEIGLRDGALRVITAFYDGPAHRAGIRSGDVILAVDGQDVSTMSVDALFESLRGEAGSQVRLTVRHPEKLSIENYVVERAMVRRDIVRGQLLDDDMGYVAIQSFGNGTSEKVREIVDRLSGLVPGGLGGLVLDLRKNPGGFLNEGVSVANLFVCKGNLVSTRGRGGVPIRSYEASGAKCRYEMPLAVLVDEGTASAAEIVAGALQDHRRAIVVGQTTFGKASIQNMYTLSDGSTLKLTIGRYYTPSGRSIQARGIVPDVEVEDLILQTRRRAAASREKDLPRALDAGVAEKAPAAASPEAPGRMAAGQVLSSDPGYETGEPLPSVDDLQLFTAIQILKSRALYPAHGE